MRDVKVPSALTLESRFVGGLPLVNAILERLRWTGCSRRLSLGVVA